MQIINQIEQLKEKQVILAMGFFDGLHQGHQDVLQAARAMAEKKNATPVVFTFYPHPLTVLKPDIKISLLTTEKEKEKLIEKSGISTIIVMRPTKEFLNEEAHIFLKKLKELSTIKGIVTGENFTFGRDAKGNITLLREYFQGTDTEIVTVPLRTAHGAIISSTFIRDKIIQGKIKEANELLTRPLMTSGQVIGGFRRGEALLACPTANLAYDTSRVIPGDGVYATKVRVGGKTYGAVTNVGKNPTFGNKERSVETFIISFTGNIRGDDITIEWLEKLRDEKRFDTIEALKAQIQKDIQSAKEIVSRA